MIVAHKALQALKRADFRNDVPATNSSGEHVMVSALPDDTMAMFFDRLREEQGPIYVITLEGEELVVVTMTPVHEPRHAAPRDDDGDCIVHRDAQLQMVIEYLRARRAAVTIYEAPDNVMVNLVDDGPPIPSLV
jgi:hypothetical protein